VPSEPTRTQLAGHAAIERALAERDDVRVLLVRADDDSARTLALVELAAMRGVKLWRGSQGDLRRMGRGADAEYALALLGASPEASLPELLSRGGISWLLHHVAYASNAGFAVRTAEVSGADGVIIDASFNHEQRARITHVSMGASRLLPIVYGSTAEVLDCAAERGLRCVAIEDVGARAPWEIDLRGPLVCLIGGERAGLDPLVLARCDSVLRIPMAGFVPSYNLQAAMAAVASERLRQLAG
jgi:tRNA G18 (ribose-2'-O)-methylase SpoU